MEAMIVISFMQGRFDLDSYHGWYHALSEPSHVLVNVLEPSEWEEPSNFDDRSCRASKIVPRVRGQQVKECGKRPYMEQSQVRN